MDFPNHSAFYTQICLSIEVSMGSHKLLYFRLLLDNVLYILFPLLYLLLLVTSSDSWIISSCASMHIETFVGHNVFKGHSYFQTLQGAPGSPWHFLLIIPISELTISL